MRKLLEKPPLLEKQSPPKPPSLPKQPYVLLEQPFLRRSQIGNAKLGSIAAIAAIARLVTIGNTAKPELAATTIPATKKRTRR